MPTREPLDSEAAVPNWPMLALAWLIYFAFGMVMSSIVPIITILRTELDISFTEMGIVLGAWQLVYIGAAAPAGILIDRVGPKRALVLGALFITLSALLRSLADGFLVLFLAVAIFGLGGPIISIGLSKLVADWFTGPARGLASGIYITGSSAGSMFALALTHILVMPLMGGSWRGSLVFYAIAAGLVTLLWVVFGRDSPQSIFDRSRQARIETKGSWRQVILDPAVIVIVMVGFSGFVASHGLRNWLPQILEAGGASPANAGLLGALPALTGIFGSILLLRVASRRADHRKRVTIGLLLVSGLTIAAISFTDGWLLIAIIALEGFCAAAVTPLMLNTLMETPSVGARNMGAAGGMFFAIGEVGGTLSPSIMGLVADLTGTFTVGVLGLAAVMWLSIIPALFIRSDTGPGSGKITESD